jgi:hypothetical protein
LRFPAHQIIFVAAERCAGVMVNVIFKESDLIFDAHLLERPVQKKIPGDVGCDQVF